MTTRRTKSQPHLVNAAIPSALSEAPAPRHRRYAWLIPSRFIRQLTCDHAWQTRPVAGRSGGPAFTVAVCPRCQLSGHS